MFESKIRRSTIRVPHYWHEAFASALRESDPGELIGRIEHAISAIERRCSEWEADPGSPAERKAILKCTSALKRLMKQEQRAGMVQSLQQLQSVNDESRHGQ
jgi:hypothetical protein